MTPLLPTPKPTHRSEQRLEPDFYQTAVGISHAQVIHLSHRLHSRLNSPWPHFNWNPSMVVKWTWEKRFNPSPFPRSCLQEEVSVLVSGSGSGERSSPGQEDHISRWSWPLSNMWGPRRESELATNDGLILPWVIRNHTLLSEHINDDGILFVLVVVQSLTCSYIYKDIWTNCHHLPVFCLITKEFEMAKSCI